MPLFAQETEPARSNWKAGVFLGPYLPANNPGITEVMKAFGARFTYFDGGFGYEAFAFRSSEDGANINYFGGSFVKGMKVPSVDEVTVLIVGGLQMTYNKRASDGSRVYPYARNSGIHLGAGLLMDISGNWSFRGGTVIFNGPGRSVYVEGGLQWSFGN